MASVDELTAQVVSLTQELQVLKNRVDVTEQNVALQQGPPTRGGQEYGVFGKKHLYPKELRETTNFVNWSERFVAWLRMENDEIATAFGRAGKQEVPLDLSGLTQQQIQYSQAIYGHLRALTEGHKKAAKIIRLVKSDNGLEAWRRLVRIFNPQNPEVHTLKLENIITYGSKHKVRSVADVPTVLDSFERILDDYEEATGQEAVNEGTKKTIMMQLLPTDLQRATRDTLMAARQTMKEVTPLADHHQPEVRVRRGRHGERGTHGSRQRRGAAAAGG